MQIIILGSAQDGGVPHLLCDCDNCESMNVKVASIAVKTKNKVLLIDATPDISAQLRILGNKIDGVLITHLHIGHYIGLLQFGKEVASTDKLPVYVTPIVAQFLKTQKPFSYLVERDQIELIEIHKEMEFDSIKIKIIDVPHRNEDGNTIGIELIDKRSIIYIPDIDYIPDSLIYVLKMADIVIFDGTFFSKTEIMRQGDVPHPAIIDTMEKLGKPDNKFYFTHLNHSNPVLDKNSDEYMEMINNGYLLASDNDFI